MKKTFLAILVAATLVACAKEDVISQNNEAIGFKQAFVDNSVRSVVDPSLTADNLTDFAVYGTVENADLFNCIRVAKDITNTELSSVWKYAGTQYWIAGAKYNFAAIAPYAKGVEGAFTVAKNGEDYVGTTTLTGYENDNTDLLYAQNAQVTGATENNPQVAFTFRHTLSKVKFSFENGYNASTATIKVYNIKIHNAYQYGDATLTVDAINWTNQNTAKVLEFGNASDNEATTGDKESVEVAYAFGYTYESLNEMLLIPGAATKLAGDTNEGYKVTFDVDLLVNNTKIKTYSHVSYVNFTPVAGNSYDIKAVVDAENIDPDNEQEPIEFTVTEVEGWKDPAQQPELPLN